MESYLLRSIDPRYAQCPPESPIALPEAAWTAARCNRLLRPLSSKISLLRKVRLYDGTQLKQDGQSESDSVSSSANSANSSTGASSSKTHCLDWNPSPRPRKKIKHTYSAREPIDSAKSETAETFDLESDLGNRLLAAILANLTNVDTSDNSLESRSRALEARARMGKYSQTGPYRFNYLKGTARARELYQRYHKGAYPEQWRLLDGINSGFETLLKVTTKSLWGNENGARSLLSTCLKKTPEYTAMYEKWYKTRDPDSAVDISSKIYEELEMSGARFIHGSNALQEVVRAHGVGLICSAVRDGVLSFTVTSSIVEHCLRLEAYNEGQDIVSSLFEGCQNSFPKPRSRDENLFTKELSILDDFATVTSRFGFLYRELTSLFENKMLPIEWISSPDMIERWSGVLQCLSERNSNAKDAGVLLRTVILMSEGLDSTSMASQVHQLRIRSRKVLNDTEEQWPRNKKQDGTGSTQSNKQYRFDAIGKETPRTGLQLLAALCALEFAQKLAQGPDESLSSVANVTTLQNLAVEAHQILETHRKTALSTKEPPFHTDGPCLILLAAGLNPGTGRKDDTAFDWYLDIFGCENLSDEFPSKAALFLSIVSSWRGQALASDGFEYIQEIVQQVLRVSSLDCCPPETRTLIGTVAKTAAIHYASTTKKPKHLSWALDTETRVNGMTVGMACQTPHRIPQYSLAKTNLGFKWEEGICEWVAGTPGVPKPKPIIYMNVGDTTSSPEPTWELSPTDPTPNSSSRYKPPYFQEFSPAAARSKSGPRTRIPTPGFLRAKASPRRHLTKTPPRESFLWVEINHHHTQLHNILDPRHPTTIEKDPPRSSGSSDSENGISNELSSSSNSEPSTQQQHRPNIRTRDQFALQSRGKSGAKKKKTMRYGNARSSTGSGPGLGRGRGGQENFCGGVLVGMGKVPTRREEGHEQQADNEEDELSFC